MALLTPEELQLHGHYVVMRSERGNEIIKTDPRQMPRRLRVLLLAIDGAQTVNLYTQKLKGFGNVSELLIELVNLGVVKLVEPTMAHQLRTAGKSEQFMALESLLDDSRFNSENAADALYGATTPGSFDDIVRVARIEQPQYHPSPAPAPAPVPAAAQRAQIESLFTLLEAVRGERGKLKQQVAKLARVKEAALRLKKDNERLQQLVYGLGIACAVLATSLVVVLLRR